MFGWAKPVPVRVGRLNDPRNDHPKVAAAGPVANLVLALVSALGLGLTIAAGGLLSVDSLAAISHGSSLPAFLVYLFQTGIQLNVLLALFNLVPVPPLDGSWVLSRFLPLDARLNYDKLRQYGFLPVIVLLILLQVSPLGGAFSVVVHRVYMIFADVTMAVIRLLS